MNIMGVLRQCGLPVTSRLLGTNLVGTVRSGRWKTFLRVADHSAGNLKIPLLRLSRVAQRGLFLRNGPTDTGFRGVAHAEAISSERLVCAMICSLSRLRGFSH